MEILYHFIRLNIGRLDVQDAVIAIRNIVY
jgi:hypothetical protein